MQRHKWKTKGLQKYEILDGKRRYSGRYAFSPSQNPGKIEKYKKREENRNNSVD